MTASPSGRWPFENQTHASWLVHFATGTMRKMRKSVDPIETTVLSVIPTIHSGFGFRLKQARIATRPTETNSVRPRKRISYNQAPGVKMEG